MGFTVLRRLKIFFSSLLLQASWSFAGLQSLGFIYTMLAAGKKAHLKRHLDCFNTHPYMSGFVIGAVLGMEEDSKTPLISHLRRSKAAMQSTFASVGDLFFWNLLRPTLAIISVILTLKFGVVGPIFFLIAYNIIHIYVRLKGISEGYKRKTAVIETLKNSILWKAISWLEIFGIFVTGLLFGMLFPAGNFNLTISLIILTAVSIFWIFKRYPIPILLVFFLIFMVIKGVI